MYPVKRQEIGEALDILDGVVHIELVSAKIGYDHLPNHYNHRTGVFNGFRGIAEQYFTGTVKLTMDASKLTGETWDKLYGLLDYDSGCVNIDIQQYSSGDLYVILEFRRSLRYWMDTVNEKEEQKRGNLIE